MRCPSCQKTFAAGKEGRRAWLWGGPYQCQNCEIWIRFSRKKDLLTALSSVILIVALLIDFETWSILVYGLLAVAIVMVLYAVKLPSMEIVSHHNNNNPEND